MREFKRKYWLHQFTGAVKATVPWVWILVGMIGLADIGLIATGGMTLVHFLMSISIFAVIYGCSAIMALAVTNENAEVEYIVYKKGFCLEYFYAYENKFIKGKQPSNGRYIKYAEIYRKLGDYKSAIAVLNTLSVGEDSISDRSSYLFVYMLSAVQMGDKETADDIWRRNQDFINKLETTPYSETYTMLNLVLAYVDCASERYDHALNIVRTVLNSKKMKKWGNYKADFLALKIFLLKKLNRESEINAAVMEFNKCAAEWKPLYESERTELRESVEKAIRGELPIEYTTDSINVM